MLFYLSSGGQNLKELNCWPVTNKLELISLFTPLALSSSRYFKSTTCTSKLFDGYTVRSESRCALSLRCADLVVSIEVAVEACCCCVTFHCIRLLNGG
jgi:hypothetical protein